MILNSYTRAGEKLLSSLSSMTSSIFPEYNRDNGVDDELVLVTSDIVFYEKKSVPDLWKNIYQAWEVINSSDQGSEIKGWRVIWQYGEEIVPGFRVFRLRSSEKPVYFYLLEEDDFYQASDKLNNLFCILSAWQHLKRKKGFYHASGVYDQDSAYLFVGVSGAGKTTTSNFSEKKGYRIIHDDHVVVYQNKKGDYRVTDRTLSLDGIPLRAVFFLNQDTADKLDRLSPMKTARGLFEGCLDSVARLVLHGDIIENAFRISADIARKIPGYELHFRKSPDFWGLIHDEFGNPQSV